MIPRTRYYRKKCKIWRRRCKRWSSSNNEQRLVFDEVYFIKNHKNNFITSNQMYRSHLSPITFTHCPSHTHAFMCRTPRNLEHHEKYTATICPCYLCISYHHTTHTHMSKKQLALQQVRGLLKGRADVEQKVCTGPCLSLTCSHTLIRMSVSLVQVSYSPAKATNSPPKAHKSTPKTDKKRNAMAQSAATSPARPLVSALTNTETLALAYTHS